MKRKTKAPVDSKTNSKRFRDQKDSHSQTEDSQDVVEDNLCPNCAKIDFDTLFATKVDTVYGVFIQPLGHPSKTSSCPLCVLFATVREAQDTDPDSPATTTTGDCHLRAFSAVDMLGVLGESEHLVDDSVFLSVLGGGTPMESKKTLGFIWRAESRLRPIMRATSEDGLQFDAFRGRKLLSSSANLCLVSQWIEFCRKHHGERCRAPRTHPVRGFNLIDCKTRRIVDATVRTPYVALSYVWGFGNANLPSPFPRFLPHRCEPIIEDTVAVVKELGMGYLWIDRYCIDQGSPKTKHEQIANMDSIYADAELVILAAAGEDPKYGLPGVHDRHRKPQPSVNIRNNLLVSALGDPIHLIKKSKWMTRAWTYQEAILARRQLAFTDEQLCFQCNGMRCLESLDLPLRQLHQNGSFMMQRVKYRSLFQYFEGKASNALHLLRPYKLGIGTLTQLTDSVRMVLNHLNEYNARELTYDTDALNAFLGVLRAYEKRPTPTSKPLIIHIYGVPIDALDDWPKCAAEGLSWNVYQWKKVERRNGFPSWSWVGWKGCGRCATGDWPWQMSATDAKIKVELADGNLITFRNGHDLRSLYPPECSKYIRITAWTTVFRLRKQDSTNKTSSPYSEVPGYWSLGEPVVEDSIFQFFRMLMSPDDPADINCVGMLMGWDTQNSSWPKAQTRCHVSPCRSKNWLLRNGWHLQLSIAIGTRVEGRHNSKSRGIETSKADDKTWITHRIEQTLFQHMDLVFGHHIEIDTNRNTSQVVRYFKTTHSNHFVVYTYPQPLKPT